VDIDRVLANLTYDQTFSILKHVKVLFHKISANGPGSIAKDSAKPAKT
jgi:hypothetical protein